MPKCKRCNSRIDQAKSAFAVMISAVSGKLTGRVVYASTLKSSNVAIHVNGDRECKKEVASYRKMLLEATGMTNECDISFLDNL